MANKIRIRTWATKVATSAIAVATNKAGRARARALVVLKVVHSPEGPVIPVHPIPATAEAAAIAATVRNIPGAR